MHVLVCFDKRCAVCEVDYLVILSLSISSEWDLLLREGCKCWAGQCRGPPDAMWAEPAASSGGSFGGALLPEPPVQQTYTWPPSAGWASSRRQVKCHCYSRLISYFSTSSSECFLFGVVLLTICRYNMVLIMFAIVNQLHTYVARQHCPAAS